MNCPRCNWPRTSQRIVNGVERCYCLRVGCHWSETVQVPKQKRLVVEHHHEPGRSTGRLLGGWFLERVLGRK